MGDESRAALPGTAVADWTTRFLAYAAGAALLWLMLLTVVAVVMRYVFNAPILGAQDISELSLAVVVFLGIPYCGWTGGHVAVDLISTVVGEAPAALHRHPHAAARARCCSPWSRGRPWTRGSTPLSTARPATSWRSPTIPSCS